MKSFTISKEKEQEDQVEFNKRKTKALYGTKVKFESEMLITSHCEFAAELRLSAKADQEVVEE